LAFSEGFDGFIGAVSAHVDGHGAGGDGGGHGSSDPGEGGGA